MSTDDVIEAALVRAICDAPHEDAPRLVYADWLTDRGDPRGEFIAAQCLRTIESRERWAALLHQHEAAWAAHVRALPNVRYRFERGFISHVELDTIESFLQHRTEIVRWLPTPEIRIAGDEVGRIVLSPNRAFAAYEIATLEAYGARGSDRHQVYELGTGALLANHLHRWATPAARTSRCWFGAGLRTLVIEYADDRDPTDLRF